MQFSLAKYYDPVNPILYPLDEKLRNEGREKWLEPVGLARNLGFSPKELRTIEALVIEQTQEVLEAWHEYF
ncbi:MAG: DUF4160 domain-containing protein [Proteobacteria bacterium]|nr:DUF4160 domain-containing protein [Pseudomonadota bacterium]MBU1582031.1 DUF4160 domain-containing protein [Pseudomonadota bacterium]MBU2452097.1 DUF4160 domain-containing protein [Pseudomonadota bacterium]